MNYTKLFITIGLIILITIVYFLLRKFIAWAIEDNDNWHKKRGHLGLHKETLNINKKVAFYELTRGYLLIIGVLVLYIVVLIVDAT